MSRKLTIYLSLILMLTIVDGALVYWLEEKSEEKHEWVTHTHQVIIQTQNLLAALIDTETGQRGYLLTNERHYLEPYGTGLDSTHFIFTNLKRLTSDNPTQQGRLETLGRLIDLKLHELRETISLHKKDPEKALEVVRTDRGKKHMDQIRLEIEKIIEDEEWLLAQRKSAYQQTRAYVTGAIILQIALVFTLVLVSFMTIKDEPRGPTFENPHIAN